MPPEQNAGGFFITVALIFVIFAHLYACFAIDG
jgi:hypothetical protein